MKTVRLGRSGPRVSRIAFGTWQLGGDWGPVYNHGLELPLTAALLGRWHHAMALGHGEDDVASAITVSAITSGQQAYI
jgi:aryl-alcohol dehydrogenase-like predicted oxidoreductase